jgi:hypothetical protein
MKVYHFFTVVHVFHTNMVEIGHVYVSGESLEDALAHSNLVNSRFDELWYGELNRRLVINSEFAAYEKFTLVDFVNWYTAQSCYKRIK